jgi:hypothetical protein
MAIWSAALTDAEAAILALGISPLLVRPASLAAYWPMIRDTDRDLVGDYHWTPYNSPTIATHPPKIRYPRLAAAFILAAASAGGFTDRGIGRGILRGLARGL